MIRSLLPRRRCARRASARCAFVLALACTPPADPGLVDLATVAPTVARDLRYVGPDNFVGTSVDGYEAAVCLLTPPAAEALASVARDLAPRELSLRVYDCYRPQRAVDHFVLWAANLADARTKAEYYPRVDKAKLFDEGYIAQRSSHSRGSTVDLTLVGDGEPLDMGTPFDFFDPLSHTESAEVTGLQRENRLLLKSAMERRGFRNHPTEWWHYTLEDEPHPTRGFDVPVR